MAGTCNYGMAAIIPERKYSKKYVEYLYQWNNQRRLKKAIAGPQDGYYHPNAIHGVRVQRKGKGAPPADNNEASFKICAKKLVPDASYKATDGLLDLSRPLTADEATSLRVEETHKRPMLRLAGRNNTSSLSGPGAVVAAEAPKYTPRRGRGEANPGKGLTSTEMQRTLTFTGEPDEETLRARTKLVWTLAPTPNMADSLLHHRMTDSYSEPSSPRSPKTPRFDDTRMSTPANQSWQMEEARATFYETMRCYARNKVQGEFGSLSLKGSHSLMSLGGC